MCLYLFGCCGRVNRYDANVGERLVALVAAYGLQEMVNMTGFAFYQNIVPRFREQYPDRRQLVQRRCNDRVSEGWERPEITHVCLLSSHGQGAQVIKNCEPAEDRLIAIIDTTTRTQHTVSFWSCVGHAQRVWSVVSGSGREFVLEVAAPNRFLHRVH